MLESQKLLLMMAAGALCLAVAPVGFAANLVVNGDFATDASGWTMLHTTSGDEYVYAEYQAGIGYPAGSVKIQRVVTNPALATDGHRYYQFIPVEPNLTYYVRGQWKGDLSDGGAGTNWAEVYIGFTADVNTAQPNWSQFLRYKKQWDGVSNQNVSAAGQWDWEDFTTSPSGAPPESFTAQSGQGYMIIAFNLGGSPMVPYTAQPYFYIDNLVVIACDEWLDGDADQDCKIDFKDVAIVAKDWLVCHTDPASSCW